MFLMGNHWVGGFGGINCAQGSLPETTLMDRTEKQVSDNVYNLAAENSNA